MKFNLQNKLSYQFNSMCSNAEDALSIFVEQRKERLKYRLIDSHYPNHMISDDGFYRFEFIPRLLTTIAIIPLEYRKKASKVLDIGAGEGWISVFFSQFGMDVYDVDQYEHTPNIDGGKLDFREYFSGKGIKSFKIDIENECLPFENEKFDLIIFTEVIEHLFVSPKEIILEIRRVLKPDGLLIISTPNYCSIRKRLNILKGNSNHNPLEMSFNHHYDVPSGPRAGLVGGHRREYTSLEMKLMMKWTKFEILSCNSFNCEMAWTVRDLVSYMIKTKRTGLFIMLKSGYNYIINKILRKYDFGEIIFILAKKV